MYVTSYIVRVCDTDPFSNKPKNVIPYKFVSQRRAMNFVKDALSRNLHAVMSRVELEVDED